MSLYPVYGSKSEMEDYNEYLRHSSELGRYEKLLPETQDPNERAAVLNKISYYKQRVAESRAILSRSCYKS